MYAALMSRNGWRGGGGGDRVDVSNIQETYYLLQDDIDFYQISNCKLHECVHLTSLHVLHAQTNSGQ